MKYAKVRLMRVEDFDGELCFAVLLNDEKPQDLRIDIFPQGFEIGEEVTLMCVHECHLKEQS